MLSFLLHWWHWLNPKWLGFFLFSRRGRERNYIDRLVLVYKSLQSEYKLTYGALVVIEPWLVPALCMAIAFPLAEILLFRLPDDASDLEILLPLPDDSITELEPLSDFSSFKFEY